MPNKLTRWVEIEGEPHAMKLKAKSFQRPTKTVCGLRVTRFDLRVPKPKLVKCRECAAKLD